MREPHIDGEAAEAARAAGEGAEAREEEEGRRGRRRTPGAAPPRDAPLLPGRASGAAAARQHAGHEAAPAQLPPRREAERVVYVITVFTNKAVSIPFAVCISHPEKQHNSQCVYMQNNWFI